MSTPPVPSIGNEPKRSRSLGFAALVLLVVFLSAASALGGAVVGGIVAYNLASRSTPVAQAILSAPTQSPPAELVVSNTTVETAITQVVEKVGPAVVTVYGVVPGQQTIFGQTPDQTVSGSGVIISKDGYILTNNHVVEDTKGVSVVLADGAQLQAKIINTDIFADLAVLRAQGQMPAVASLGNSDALKVGETVVAIGSPLGDFKNTVTVGVISATGRSLDTGKGYLMENLIQTDAAINEGNSGGPLVNLAGDVIGINTMIVRGSGSSAVAEGLGFALPANTARLIGEQIMQKGYFARPVLGINWQAINPNIAYRFNLPVEWGVYVTAVDRNGPAGKAGIEENDIITRIGSTSLNENTSFYNALFSFQPGQQVEIEVARGKQQLNFEVTLGASTAQ